MSPRTTATAAAAAILAGCGGGGGETTPAPPILKVTVAGATQHSRGDATAFAVGDGRAVTVAHVLRSGHPVYVAGRRARVLRFDRRLDVAVLAVPGVHGPELLAGSPHAGERTAVRVLRAGAARSVRATVRRTISARVRSVAGPVHVRPALELAAAVMPGDSGAPVVDREGRVVGVIFAQASDREAVAYALDARALGAILGR